jgi:transmembrane 9 superfamily protein 2/4
MVAIIILRTLNNDIASCNNEDAKENPEDIVGWKLLHGDVFRPPKLAGLLSALVGSGIQFLLATTIIVVMAAIGILSPGYRGSLMSYSIFIFAFMGPIAGYFGTRLYKNLKGVSWKSNALLTSMIPPGLIFVVVFFLNFFNWFSGSSNAIPFGTFTALAIMWGFISTPLIYVGSYFGNKKQGIEFPVKTHQIARQIPEQPWYLQPAVIILISGLVPFAVILLELFFILKSMWQSDQYYYMFGFLGVVCSLLLFTCIEMTIVIVYFSLSAENWRWHWRSFLVSGSSSLYIFAYSGVYFMTKLEIEDTLSSILYFFVQFSGLFYLLVGNWYNRIFSYLYICLSYLHQCQD